MEKTLKKKLKKSKDKKWKQTLKKKLKKSAMDDNGYTFPYEDEFAVYSKDELKKLSLTQLNNIVAANAAVNHRLDVVAKDTPDERDQAIKEILDQQQKREDLVSELYE